jgi:predicted phage terminase large subunit-like protein
MIDPQQAIRETATPADFAIKASRGRWKSARHLEAINRELVNIATGKNDRLIVQIPPRHGKSMLISQYGAAWFRMTFPLWNIMLTGATSDLAQRFSTRVRGISEEWSPVFGLLGLDVKTQSWERWKLAGTGVDQGELYAAGIGGRNLMGAGCQLLIVDDYHGTVEEALSEAFRKRNYEWYLATSSTRLEPGGAVVVIATRWHNDDLIGRLLADEEQGGDKWRVVRMPAIDEDGNALWPERWPIERLMARRAKYYARGYGWMWDALFQQEPPLALDSEWPSHYFDHIWAEQWPTDKHICAVALDASLGKSDKSDYSAFIAGTKGHDGIYYIDADIERRDASRIVEAGIEFMNIVRPQFFGCETEQFQELLLPLFEPQLHRCRIAMNQVFGIHTEGVPKITRIRRLTHWLATGRIKIRRSPGGHLLVEQLQNFPNHKFDDGPDALEMVIRLCEELLHGSGFEEPDEVLTT